MRTHVHWDGKIQNLFAHMCYVYLDINILTEIIHEKKIQG